MTESFTETTQESWGSRIKFIFSALIAFAFSMTTIATAWIFYRPIIGIPLIVLAIMAIAGLVMLGLKKKA